MQFEYTSFYNLLIPTSKFLLIQTMDREQQQKKEENTATEKERETQTPISKKETNAYIFIANSKDHNVNILCKSVARQM